MFRTKFQILSVMTLTLACLASSSAFAVDCTDSQAIKDEAVAAGRKANATKDVTVQQDGITFSRTTKDGTQDKYTVLINVNDECEAAVYVYTEHGSCKVNSSADGAIHEGGCG